MSTSNLGVYNHYESEYIVFNPKIENLYKVENRFFLTTNLGHDKQSITEYPHV